ncbi:hypothetical protein Gohar_007104 [Gossypium harknessii]|uniref:Uncharacterized protein n=1 Tax=Gossypium harknessii TaxID=34285 RepID=A0A7J9GFH1_9ROSI|nr:hypothetical protein [Gossypium harknessii]
MSGAYPNPYMYPFSIPIQAWNVWLDASHFPMTPSQPIIYRPSSQEGPHEASSGSSTHFQSHRFMGFKLVTLISCR